ncbi:EamA family transporter, partial [Micromonospora sp. STR1s_6]
MSISRTARPAAPAPAVNRARTGLIQITVTGVLWGTTGVAVQLLRESTGLSPVSIGFHRLAIAALVLLACTAGRPRTLLAALRAAPVPLLLTGVGLGLYQALYFVAVAWAGVTAGRPRTLLAALRAAPVPLLLTGVGLGLYQAL